MQQTQNQGQSPEGALQLLDRLVSQMTLNRQEHVIAQQAVQLLHVTLQQFRQLMEQKRAGEDEKVM